MPGIKFKYLPYKRGHNLPALSVRSRSGRVPLNNPTIAGSDSSQDLTTMINALDEV